MKMKKLHRYIIFSVKYYAVLCSFLIALTMLFSIIDNLFGTNLYLQFIKFTPTIGASIWQTGIIFLFALATKMCLWNKILYIPIFTLCIYSQLYQFKICVPYWTYYLFFIALFTIISSTILFTNGRKKKSCIGKCAEKISGQDR